MLTYCQWDPWKENAMKFKWKYILTLIQENTSENAFCKMAPICSEPNIVRQCPSGNVEMMASDDSPDTTAADMWWCASCLMDTSCRVSMSMGSHLAKGLWTHGWNFVKSLFVVFMIVMIYLGQICTYASLRSDGIVNFQAKTTRSFTRFGLLAHTKFCDIRHKEEGVIF